MNYTINNLKKTLMKATRDVNITDSVDAFVNDQYK